MLSRQSFFLFSTFAKTQAKRHLTPAQLQSYENDGYLVLKGFLPQKMREDLVKWADEIQTLPEEPGRLMKYFERSSITKERLLCRVENILPYYDEIRSLSYGILTEISSELFGEPAVIYKEKLNFKFPKGNGFNAHQDQPAFVTFGCPKHLTVMLAIDPNTRESGGLDFVKGKHQPEIMPQNADGSLRTDLQARLNWIPLDAEPGDVVFFDSYAPHRSDINTSTFTRRNLYLTYNPLSFGNFREEYFVKKRTAFPPECERDPNKDYSEAEKIYNVANPIK
jgi:2-aminoethylphosphonate dioxygenase